MTVHSLFGNGPHPSPMRHSSIFLHFLQFIYLERGGLLGHRVYITVRGYALRDMGFWHLDGAKVFDSLASVVVFAL